MTKTSITNYDIINMQNFYSLQLAICNYIFYIQIYPTNIYIYSLRIKALVKNFLQQ